MFWALLPVKQRNSRAETMHRAARILLSEMQAGNMLLFSVRRCDVSVHHLQACEPLGRVNDSAGMYVLPASKLRWFGFGAPCPAPVRLADSI